MLLRQLLPGSLVPTGVHITSQMDIRLQDCGVAAGVPSKPSDGFGKLFSESKKIYVCLYVHECNLNS